MGAGMEWNLGSGVLYRNVNSQLSRAEMDSPQESSGRI